ncbi:hypothetical protein B0H15DRAFT_949876 [Mycena belliarum]|uniref:Uncharacterized protein n=1 Tax=Mycena belliarum TaxID=1033014 RepID=A0AAD6U4G7_9AGAR|nr:hypothetical protein B0H15DRAFT_949874 [Mycena belliae]KAJ7088062.1 hypothetical protein B0H15DRAFT_949876 [Mycena belliae]
MPGKEQRQRRLLSRRECAECAEMIGDRVPSEGSACPFNALPSRSCKNVLLAHFKQSIVLEDMNGCITAWVRERLAPAAPPARLPPLTVPPTRPVTVGIHIRWGDAASAAHAAPASSVPTHFRGSMNTPALRRILADLRASPLGAHGLRLTVAMEHADARVLAALGEPDYTLLDSRGGAGGALADLHALGNQDVLLLGESSWGVLVHLVAPPGLTIVEFSGGNKYVNATGFGRDVVFLEGYTPEVLAAGWPRVDVP